jgi:hypothetical protein
MIAAMWIPYLLLTVPYLLGSIDGDVLTMGGHVLMLPCMLLAVRDLAPWARSRMAGQRGSGGGSDPSASVRAVGETADPDQWPRPGGEVLAHSTHRQSCCVHE